MTDLLQQLDELQDQAQALVGDIARDASYAELHTNALAMLLSIVNLRNSAAPNQVASPGDPPSTSHDDITAEIARVGRKLPRWARNQTQINSRILTLFLEIRRDGHSRITEDDLSLAYGDASEFYRNFMQMKAIAKLVDQGVSNDAGATIRVGNAKLIFENAWESEALRRVLASKRLPHTVVSEARNLLGARG